MAQARRDDVDAVMATSRALLAIVVRSTADALEEISLTQFRVLVVLVLAGETRIGLLAERLGVHQSTLTRTTNRLVSGGWIERGVSPENRREVLVSLAPAGKALVDDVMAKRRRLVEDALAHLSRAQQTAVRDAFTLFAEAAGEPVVDDLLLLGL